VPIAATVPFLAALIAFSSCEEGVSLVLADHHETEPGRDGLGRILVGVDGSASSTRATWYAIGLARRERASLVVLFVASIMARFPHDADPNVAAAICQTFDEAACDLQRSAQMQSAEFGVPTTFIAAHGDPYTELCRVAARTRPDALVVGAGRKAGSRTGSLAVRLVKAGRWPVTVVP
jgi:nucleotide-binding universal stress UspA family protein